MTTDEHQSAYQAGVLALGRILSVLAEVVTPLAIVRLLGKAEVGVLVALLLVYTTTAMVLTLGLPNVLQFYLPGRSAGERRGVTKRVALLLLGAGALMSAILGGLSAFSYTGLVANEMRLDLMVFLVGLPLGDIPLRMLPTMLVVEGMERAAAGVSVIRSLGMTLGTLVPLALGAELWTVMAVLSGVGVVFGSITYWYYRRTYGSVETVDPAESPMEVVRFAFPLGLTELVVNLNQRVDRFLIIPLGAIALAEYQSGSWQIPIIPGISYAVGVAYGPRLARLFKEGAGRQALKVWRDQSSKTALLVVPIAMVFAVAAEETIEVFFTRAYLNGASVFRLYALMTLGRITAFGTVLVAAGKPRFVLRSAIIALMANVVLSVPLVVAIGFNGPAVGTMLAFIPMVCTYSWYIGRSVGVPFRYVFPFVPWLKVVAAAAVPAAAAIGFKLTVDLAPAVMLMAEAVIVLVGFLVVASATGLITRKEVDYMKSVILLRKPVPEASE